MPDVEMRTQRIAAEAGDFALRGLVAGEVAFQQFRRERVLRATNCRKVPGNPNCRAAIGWP